MGVIKLKFLIFGGLSGENCKTMLRSYQVMRSFIKTSALNNSQDYLLRVKCSSWCLQIIVRIGFQEIFRGD